MKKRFLLTILILLTAMVLAGKTAHAEGEPDNGIPVIYITIDESQGSIDDMNSSKNHTASCKGTVSIDVPDGFHFVDMPEVDLSDLPESAMTIRGRGNSTWLADKKPYKLKLDKKANVLGLGKNKHWVLLANAYDRTLIKDRITGWLGDEIGLEFTPRGVPVDLVMRNTTGTYNEYLGSYYLSEQVRVGENRIEIEELTENDVDDEVITGGYLVQNGVQVGEGSVNYFKTDSGEEWANHTPNFDVNDDGYENEKQMNYIRGYMQATEDALFSTDYSGVDTPSYRDMMDLESAAKYWLVNEACKNGDAYCTGSTYLYKYRDDPKLYWGPLWDFDYAWYYDNSTDRFDCRHQWLFALMYDRGEGGFVQEVKKQWPAVKTALLYMAEDGGLIDQYYKETKASQAKDLEINPEKVPPMGGKAFDPEEARNSLKTWINNRVKWMDDHMSDLDTFVHKVTIIVDESTSYNRFIMDKSPVYVDVPQKEGYYFQGWLDVDGNPFDNDVPCTKDVTIKANFISEEDAPKATDIYLQCYEDYVNYVGVEGSYYVQSTVLPLDALSRNVTWTSSDEEIATVDTAGYVTYKKPGDVEITATLDCGASATLLLHVIDGDLPFPESISMTRDTISLETGEVDQVMVEKNPKASLTTYLSFSSDDPEVAEVDMTGVVRALKPGKTTITAYLRVPSEDEGEGVILEVSCEVIVEEAEPTPIETKTYNIIEGDGQAWYKGSDKAAQFIFKGSENDEETFTHYKGIKVDDGDVPDSGYTAEAGSVVIKLKSEYLETLSTGKHKLTVSFDDAEEVNVFFTIIANSDPSKDDKDSGDSDKGTPDKSGDDQTPDNGNQTPDNSGSGTTPDKQANTPDTTKANSPSKAPEQSKSVNTGDTINLTFGYIIMLISLIACLIIIILRHRIKANDKM